MGVEVEMVAVLLEEVEEAKVEIHSTAGVVVAMVLQDLRVWVVVVI